MSATICLLAFAFRLPTISARSLWLDEAYSAWFSSLSLRELWTDVPHYETHPPFYYTLLKGWTLLFGTSEGALRAPSLIASVATVFLTSVSAKLLKGDKIANFAALFGALLLAVNRGNILYAQDARPYALETLAAYAAILSAMRLLQALAAPDEGRRRYAYLPAAVALSLTGGLTLWMHNTAVFIDFGVWLGLLLALLVYVPANRIRNLAVIACTGVVAILLWSPFLPFFLAQGESVNSMSFWIHVQLDDLWTAWYLVAGGNAPFVPVMGAALLGLCAIWRKLPASALAITVILVVPLYTVVGLGFAMKPIYINRLFEWMAPPVLVLAGTGVFMTRFPVAFRATLAVCAVALSIVSLTQPVIYDDYRMFVNHIAERAQKGDIVIASPTEIDPALRYYARQAPAFPEARVIPGNFPYRAAGRTYISNLGAPRIEPADAQIVRDAIKHRKRVWLLERTWFLYDPTRIVRSEILRTHRETLTYGDGVTSVTLFE
jgi:uncharacterized membrane protein